jgi:uncharacterized protein (TIGR02246 family)
MNLRLLPLLLLVACSAPPPKPITGDPGAEVRATLEAQVAAWNRGDMDAFLSAYWPDPGLTFFSGGSVTKGFAPFAERFKARYGQAPETMGKLEFRHLEVLAGSPSAAFARGEWHLERPGQQPQGGLFTLILEKQIVDWKIVHDHTSVFEPTATTAGGGAEAFFAGLAGHCGKAFAGRIVANEPTPTVADPFEGKNLIVHFRRCEADRLEMPFHVGNDHSRTWVLTRGATALTLKHDHRHEDGSPDALTMYGGTTAAAGTAQRQEFPADAETKALFTRQNLPASVPNVWALEIEPNARLVYELARPGRLFRVEFDLTQPVAAPPAPWG